ncbi:MAG: cyclic nucleotide-binding domain-containing protein [Nitrospirae bacterium]|nr:cyclic nucleotide-binding domain-containing protein [Nitrospirota bacterium]
MQSAATVSLGIRRGRKDYSLWNTELGDIGRINFRDIPLLKELDKIDLVKLIPHFELLEYQAGATLFRQGDTGDALFIIVKGSASVVVSNHSGRAKIANLGPNDVIGEMALLTGEPRSADVEALTDLAVLRLKKISFDSLAGESISFSRHLNKILARKLYKSDIPPLSEETITSPLKENSHLLVRVCQWTLIFIIPAFIVLYGREMGLENRPSYFLAILTAMVLMWIFKLVDEYVPGLFVLSVTLAMGLAPTSLVLSGFASDGFFMALSFLGLGTVILISGLSYRVLLQLLFRLPNTQFWHNVGLLLTGFFLTPLIPSANGRMALVSPFAEDMADILHLKSQGAASTRIALSAFTGASLLSGVFLSSKSVNFIILGLLPRHMQDKFQWADWTLAAWVTGVLMLIMYVIGVHFVFHNQEIPRFSKEHMAAQMELLGKAGLKEWGAIVAVAVFVVGIVTLPLHKIQVSWLSLAILCGLLFSGSLNKKEFRERIDWPFLLYLAELVGIIRVFDYLGLDQWVGSGLSHIGVDKIMSGNFTLFITFIFIAIFFIRLAVPISATIVILAALFMPLAERHGINPWIIGFVILVLGEIWVFPYQCSYYLQLQEMNLKKQLYNENAFLKFNMLMNFVRIAAIYLSIPYWKMIGLL